jgi:hypothetical protein
MVAEPGFSAARLVSAITCNPLLQIVVPVSLLIGGLREAVLSASFLPRLGSLARH